MLSNNLQHLILVLSLSLSQLYYPTSTTNGKYRMGTKEIYGSYAIGHTDPEGCSQINWFGMDFAGHGYRWTEALCRLDSDGDGQTNGFELGIPVYLDFWQLETKVHIYLSPRVERVHFDEKHDG